MAVEDINIIIEDANETVSVTVNEVTEEVTVIVNDFSISNIISNDSDNAISLGADGGLWAKKLDNTDELPEGVTNLYFTDARAKNAVISQAITNGVTDKSPSEDVVFDKLLLKQNLPTGFVSGLQLSIHPTDNTKAIIAPGGYIITDFSDVFNVQAIPVQVLTPIEFTPAFLLTSPSTYIALDINGEIVPSVTPFDNDDRRTLCLIGNVVHSNNININVVNEIKAPIVAPTNQLHDLIKAVGFLNLDGNLFSPNGANLSLNKTAGRIFGLGINGSDFLDPHRLTLPLLTAATFRYRLSNSVEFGNTTLLDPTQYESSPGVLTPLSNNNRWSVQHLHIFQSNTIRIQPAQHEHTSFVNARNAAFTESFTTEANIADNAIFRCYIIMKKTCTNLALDIANGEAEIIHIGKFGNAIGGSTSALTLANIISVLGYTPENEANKVTTITGNETSTTLYTSIKSVVDWVTSLFVPKTRTLTINGTTQDLSSDRSFTVSGGGTSPKYATLLSSDLDTQDVDGFVIYANALSPNLVIAQDEFYDFIVTDTGQIFKLYKSGVTIGLGQTAITSADVLELKISKFEGVFKGDRIEHQATGAAISSFGAAAPTTVVSGSNATANFAVTYDTLPSNTWNRRVSNTAATAGLSAEFYDNARVFCANGLGYYFSAKLATSLISTNSRAYVGLTDSNAATGNVNPSTLLNMISVGFDSADLHWYIMHNDGSGTATKVDTGFVLDKPSVLPNNQRELDLTVEIFNFYGSPTVYFKIKSLRQNTTFFHVATTNLPGVNTGLTYHLWANNGTDNVVINMVWSNILIQRQS